jgi:hypothetical protein
VRDRLLRRLEVVDLRRAGVADAVEDDLLRGRDGVGRVTSEDVRKSMRGGLVRGAGTGWSRSL